MIATLLSLDLNFIINILITREENKVLIIKSLAVIIKSLAVTFPNLKVTFRHHAPQLFEPPAWGDKAPWLPLYHLSKIFKALFDLSFISSYF